MNVKQPSRGLPDFLLLFFAVLLVCFGITMVFSSSSSVAIYKYGSAWYFAQKQIIFAVLGFIVMLVFMNIKFAALKRVAAFFLLMAIGSLILVLLIGEDIKGATRWIKIGPVGVQPTEFFKLAIIIYLSYMINKMGEKLEDFKNGLLPLLIIVSIPTLLILRQPDFGSSLLLLSVSGILLLVGGAKIKHFLVIIAGLVPICIYLVTSKSYRLERITAFMNPWEDSSDTGYQLIQSLYAFGNGGFSGVGFGRSIQKSHYLPEAHTDFIFSIIGEELGFIGVTIFLLVFFVFIIRGLAISVQCKDQFGQLLGIGIVSMMGIQLFLNLGAVTGLLPITGISLPLISYGGSSLLTYMAGIGILLSISRENYRNLKKKDR